MSRRSTSVTALAVCIVLVLSTVLLAGCSGTKPAPDVQTRSEETTQGFPSTTPSAPVEPPPPMLRDPKAAVYSYLMWISYAYKLLNSDVATHAFSVYEEVRINSYVEYNRQQGKAIDQRLESFEVKDLKQSEETATVQVVERWKYRYIDIKQGVYSSPVYDVTYDSTYSLVKEQGKGWVVDSVKATPRGEAP